MMILIVIMILFKTLIQLAAFVSAALGTTAVQL